MITEEDIEKLASAARVLPPSTSVYLEEDFVMNLLETVLDYMLQTEVVVRALERFRENRWNEVRSMDELEQLMARFPEDQAGNTALAQHLWGYNLWTRAQQLRELARYFRRIGVVDQQELRGWALASTFKNDFEGRVKGLGPAVYQWLVMRQGVDTVKPDVHVRRFAEAAVGRRLNDQDVIELTTKAAQSIGIKAFELDWLIWRHRAEARSPTQAHQPERRDTTRMRKDVREFIRQLESAGLTVEPRPGHYHVLRDDKPLRKQNGMPFTLPFSPDTTRWRRAAIVELRKLGIDL